MPKKPSKKKQEFNYYGDVEVVVRMRYRIEATVNSKSPSKEEIHAILKNGIFNDVFDTEELEYIQVNSVGENCAEEESND